MEDVTDTALLARKGIQVHHRRVLRLALLLHLRGVLLKRGLGPLLREKLRELIRHGLRDGRVGIHCGLLGFRDGRRAFVDILEQALERLSLACLRDEAAAIDAPCTQALLLILLLALSHFYRRVPLIVHLLVPDSVLRTVTVHSHLATRLELRLVVHCLEVLAVGVSLAADFLFFTHFGLRFIPRSVVQSRRGSYYFRLLTR